MAEDRLTATLIADGHHLPPEVLKTFVRAKTPERVILVSDVSCMAGLPPGRCSTQLCDLEILADGRLVLAGQDQLLAGAARPLLVGIANMVRSAGVDLRTAVEMASRRPAELLGLKPRELAENEPTDFLLVRGFAGDVGADAAASRGFGPDVTGGVGAQTSDLRTAHTAACVRSVTPILRRMCCTCSLTVS